ncbi:MAG: prepilin-type N-terminal cleavage/methylation domain-containing protein [Candidatus Omnitrophica bacterium]|nr:prepilin-type N-terminal cleavage/methylation domain-containing protein [Candidatus Omnitrophota bacterium]
MNRNAFSLVEIMVVVIVIGILAGISIPRYSKFVERGRSAEARNILGNIRSAELAYLTEYDIYTNSLTSLQIAAPTACNASFYFSYGIVNGSGTFTATANRCTGGAGRPPTGPTAFSLNITQAGVLDGTVGYL